MIHCDASVPEGIPVRRPDGAATPGSFPYASTNARSAVAFDTEPLGRIWARTCPQAVLGRGERSHPSASAAYRTATCWGSPTRRDALNTITPIRAPSRHATLATRPLTDT